MLRVALVNDQAKPPYREEHSVGFDCFSFGYNILSPGETKLIPLGFHAALPDGYGAFIWDRSSFGSRGIHTFHQLITNQQLLEEIYNAVPFAGVLDWSYRGQWGVVLHNFSNKIYEYPHGSKITQFVILKCELMDVEVISMDDLMAIPSERGTAGFGSTDEIKGEIQKQSIKKLAPMAPEPRGKDQ